MGALPTIRRIIDVLSSVMAKALGAPLVASVDGQASRLRTLSLHRHRRTIAGRIAAATLGPATR
jgi:hypothetical protein